MKKYLSVGAVVALSVFVVGCPKGGKSANNNTTVSQPEKKPEEKKPLAACEDDLIRSFNTLFDSLEIKDNAHSLTVHVTDLEAQNKPEINCELANSAGVKLNLTTDMVTQLVVRADAEIAKQPCGDSEYNDFAGEMSKFKAKSEDDRKNDLLATKANFVKACTYSGASAPVLYWNLFDRAAAGEDIAVDADVVGCSDDLVAAFGAVTDYSDEAAAQASINSLKDLIAPGKHVRCSPGKGIIADDDVADLVNDMEAELASAIKIRIAKEAKDAKKAKAAAEKKAKADKAEADRLAREKADADAEKERVRREEEQKEIDRLAKLEPCPGNIVTLLEGSEALAGLSDDSRPEAVALHSKSDLFKDFPAECRLSKTKSFVLQNFFNDLAGGMNIGPQIDDVRLALGMLTRAQEAQAKAAADKAAADKAAADKAAADKAAADKAAADKAAADKA
ncbi:MAG: hypothetical protein HYX41_06190, partial [Bdellovibrio sp.]|nr:hypothetical protein [Bdellovibrio sp.]